MLIVSSKKHCEALLPDNYKSLLNNYQYKRILNEFYDPDAYLFFTDGVDLIPLVKKNGIVTFYGGIHYNEYNTLTTNQALLNYATEYLVSKNYHFRLLSITNDFSENLNLKNRKYDVPYNVNWIFNNIGNYKTKNLLDNFSKKKRYKINRIVKQKDNYSYTALSYDDLKSKLDLLHNLHLDYFQNRGLNSGWEGKDVLLKQILEYFNQTANLFVKVVKKDNKYVGMYILVYNNDEIVYLFGGPLDENDINMSMLIYIDILENAQIIAKKYGIMDLDGMRGSFGYKKKLQFTPNPLYALVHDINWHPKFDSDLSEEEILTVFKRTFGVFDD